MSGDATTDDEAERRDDRRADGGVPTNAELSQRLVAVEQGQQHLGERMDDRIDGIEQKIDGLREGLGTRLEALEGEYETTRRRTSAMWLAVRIARWAIPFTVGAAATVGVAVFLT